MSQQLTSTESQRVLDRLNRADDELRALRVVLEEYNLHPAYVHSLDGLAQLTLGNVKQVCEQAENQVDRVEN